MSDARKNARLSYDSDNKSIQVAGDMQEHDAAGTAVVSPKSVGSGIQQFTIPDNALVLIISCDADFRYGSNRFLNGAAAGKGYYKAVADKDTRIPCGKSEAIWVKPDSYPGVFHFFFEMI